MKQRFAVVFMVFAAGFAAQAADEPTSPKEWFACEKDRDCGRAETLCGDPQGINLEHYHDYRDYLDGMSKSSCKPGKKIINLREMKSICQGGQCTFDRAPDYGSH